MRPPVVLASLEALIGLAVPAHADPGPDASFLDALNNAGITYHNGPDAIAIGRRARQLMDQGHPERDVIKSMTQQNSGFTGDGATRFTQIAETVYCAQHTGGAVAPPPPAQQPNYPLPGGFPWPALPGAM
jgi:Protein of unknown function (DUF732)